MQPRTLAYETGAASHVGLVRQENEDSYLVLPEIGVWVVADGLGGHARGQFASLTIVSALQSIGYPASAPDLLARFEDRIERANATLQNAIREGGALLGSTVAALLVHEGSYTCFWSGDSRVYLIRDGTIVQLTTDHTEMQDLLQKGLLDPEEAAHWPRRHVVTQAIGIHERPQAELRHGWISPGDTFLLCSDGLNGHADDTEILEVGSQGSAQAACDRLIDLVLSRGGTDNVTIVIVRFNAPGAPIRPSQTLLVPRE